MEPPRPLPPGRLGSRSPEASRPADGPVGGWRGRAGDEPADRGCSDAV